MDAGQRLHIEQQLSTLKYGELASVAGAALAECRDLQCQQDVLTAALNRAGQLLPTHVSEGGRVAIATGAGFAAGMLRGGLGDLWGRVATAVPALVGLTVGLASKSASMKAGGYSILAGTAAGEAAVEAYDIGQILRAKMRTPVAKAQAVAAPVAT
jgi:hypothetical protein